MHVKKVLFTTVLCGSLITACVGGGGSDSSQGSNPSSPSMKPIVPVNPPMESLVPANPPMKPIVPANPPMESLVPANNPFGTNVIILSPDDKNAQQKVDSIYNAMWKDSSQFSDNRYAILLKPGTYNNLDIKVGYYTEVAGLGRNPDDVHIIGAVRTRDTIPTDPGHPDWGPGALNNFWRSMENLSITPTLGSIDYPTSAIPANNEVWAVSQASPIRRVHIINGDLRLFDIGWSSGGFMADTLVDGDVITGSQQQWLSRNSNWLGRWQPGNWNMVFLGAKAGDKACFWGPGGWQSGVMNCTVSMPDSGDVESHPFIAVAKTPLVSEKPFLVIDSKGNYSVDVPALKSASSGVDFPQKNSDKLIPLSQFLIANPQTTVATINSALKSGKNVIFTPGVYHLTDTINVTNANQIVLGLGDATLVAPGKGIPSMQVADVEGVKIAGIIFDANQEAGDLPTLLNVGVSVSTSGNPNNPTELYDIFCRVGGAVTGQVDSCVTINSNSVIGDNLWLWRADHGNGVGWDMNKANTGLKVFGDNVRVYGLAVEHFEKFQTIWQGDNGFVAFYQSEAPYDVPDEMSWGGNYGYNSYYVGSSVKSHTLYGAGVYSNFLNHGITLGSAINVGYNPSGGGNILIKQAFTVFLDNYGSITHVINDQGATADMSNKGKPQYSDYTR